MNVGIYDRLFLFQDFPSLHEAGEIEIFKILCLN